MIYGHAKRSWVKPQGYERVVDTFRHFHCAVIDGVFDSAVACQPPPIFPRTGADDRSRETSATTVNDRSWPNSAGSQQKELSEQRANPDLPAFPPAAKFAIT